MPPDSDGDGAGLSGCHLSDGVYLLSRYAMKLLTTAGVLLALALAGCTAPSSYSSSSPRASTATKDQANYHADNFGEPDNTPFQGVYPGR